jgi:hypothetical protein
MYETRGYPIDVIVRDRRSRERADKRAQRVAALRNALRVSVGRAEALRGPR